MKRVAEFLELGTTTGEYWRVRARILRELGRPEEAKLSEFAAEVVFHGGSGGQEDVETNTRIFDDPFIKARLESVTFRTSKLRSLLEQGDVEVALSEFGQLIGEV